MHLPPAHTRRSKKSVRNKKVHWSAIHALSRNVKHGDKTRQDNHLPNCQATGPMGTKTYHGKIPSRLKIKREKKTCTEDGDSL